MQRSADVHGVGGAQRARSLEAGAGPEPGSGRYDPRCSPQAPFARSRSTRGVIDSGPSG